LPDGWIKIHARYQAGTVAVTISNCSYDISVGDRDRIFDRFYRGNPARDHRLQGGVAYRQIEGVGLGLSLSREIARAHGGDLKLDSTPVGQTTFTLTLPIVEQKN
jgi:signal transduction histidine kinase